MFHEGKKKRPPKLENLCPDGDTFMDRIQFVSATSDGSSCNLDKTVKVNFDGQKDVLICPSQLTVLQELGRGQYGIVEKVSHKPTGCQFAVKRVPLRSGDNSEQQRLLMDVDILVKGTECRNIIKFFGALIWEGDLWILMELMDCSLDKFYRLAHKKQANSPLFETEKYQPDLAEPCSHVSPDVELGNCQLCNMVPERVLGCIASDMLKALNYLYSIKVIHRDIKPSNILINLDGIVKLCDFGISGYLVDSVANTYEAGCQPYMAPERIDPLKARTGYDIKSDVWSFGITMLEIAIGRYPYSRARNFFEQLKRICTDEPPRLPNGRHSGMFENFLQICLAKDYRDRPKFDTLESHPFILNNNNESDIKTFTKRILPQAGSCPI